MKIIDNLLLVSHRYIAGIETSEEYKALVKRIKDGDKMKKEYRLNNMERNEMLEMLRNLRCCGNCEFCYSALTCAKTLDPTFADNYCDNWQSDKMTRTERMKE